MAPHLLPIAGVLALGVAGLLRENLRLRAQVQRLQETESEKDRMMALLAHELRNPLNGVSNAVHLMRLKGCGDLDRPQALAERGLQQMSRLIDDLMDMSRITRGRVQLRYTSIDLRELLLSALPPFEEAARTKGLHLEIIAPEPLVIFGDPLRVSQVFSNLLANALKFTDEGTVQVKLYRADRSACVTVRDSGIGIPSAVLPHVWEPFRQGKVSEGRGGLGLGLSVVKGLVELHGGSVKADSDGAGTGACFTVELPLEEGLRRS